MGEDRGQNPVGIMTCSPCAKNRAYIHRVDIQQPALKDSGWDSPQSEWITLYESVPARVEYKRGSERFVRSQDMSETQVPTSTHHVSFRYLPINAQYRLVWDGRILNIESYGNPDGMRVDGLAVCVEDTSEEL